MKEIIVAKDTNELFKIAAEKFVSIVQSSIEENGKFTVALAGGSTPKALYNLLASENFRFQINWQKVFFFFGDERNVLLNDEESNFRMVNESLLRPLLIGENQIFRWQTEIGDPEIVAEKYERAVKVFFNLGESEFPRFDLILLGMGDDGHTASLFPFTDALRERRKIAVANTIEKLNTIRLTLTFPVINHSANVIFLITGEKKAEVLRSVLQGEFEPEKFPSQMVKPVDGNVFWILDEKAAQLVI